MSTEAVTEFHRVVLASPELQGQLHGAVNEEAFVAKVIALGAERGYQFTEDEVRAEIARAYAGVRELSEGELAAVSGGLTAELATYASPSRARAQQLSDLKTRRM
jgi:predicted ribosomally synthesized peptide with nif11-like leader